MYVFYQFDEMAFTEVNINAKQYIDVLRGNLCNSAVKLGSPNSYYFHFHNNPKLTAYITKF